MDIKLRARLSAYSKIESIQGMNNNLPHPDATAEGHVLGVGSNGQYTLIRRVTPEDMSEKWGQAQSPEVTSKEWIGTLFDRPAEATDVINKETIDSLFDNKSTEDQVDVTEKGTIDTLFDKEASDTSVNVAEKDTIDQLFTKTSTPKVGTVSYAAIDSLFNK